MILKRLWSEIESTWVRYFYEAVTLVLQVAHWLSGTLSSSVFLECLFFWTNRSHFDNDITVHPWTLMTHLSCLQSTMGCQKLKKQKTNIKCEWMDQQIIPRLPLSPTIGNLASDFTADSQCAPVSLSDLLLFHSANAANLDEGALRRFTRLLLWLAL